MEHTTLLDILRIRFGVTGSARKELNLMSRTLIVHCPKVHNLDPLKFVAYVAGLQEVANRRGILFHGFGDHSQLRKHAAGQ